MKLIEVSILWLAVIIRNNLHDWRADDEHRLPLIPVQR